MKLMKQKWFRWLLLFSLSAIGLATFFIISDWFPIFGTLFVSPSSLAKTDGVVYKSNIDILKGGSDGAGLVRGQRFKICHYKIYYSFTINGKIYRSKRVNFLSANNSACDKVNEYVTKYYVGKSVTVYYLPSLPWISVLEPQNKINFFDYLISNFLIPYGIILFLLIPMMQTRERIAKQNKSDTKLSTHDNLHRKKNSKRPANMSARRFEF